MQTPVLVWYDFIRTEVSLTKMKKNRKKIQSIVMVRKPNHQLQYII